MSFEKSSQFSKSEYKTEKRRALEDREKEYGQTLVKIAKILRALFFAGTIFLGIRIVLGSKEFLDLLPEEREAYRELTQEKSSLEFIKKSLFSRELTEGSKHIVKEGKETEKRIVEKERRLEVLFGMHYKEIGYFKVVRDSGGEELLMVDKALVGTNGILRPEGIMAFCERTFPSGWVGSEVEFITY